MQDPPEGAQRKLAAIMFTDIKGFSKKMAEDETRAFELLKMHDAIMRVLVAKFSGTVIKSLGDSFMVDFSSAVNAVKCSVEAQKRFWNFNRDKDEFERVEIRIGIHLGDVLVRDEDMIGDGVNVASRIEAITEPNRVCISQEVYMQIRNKFPIQVYEIGPMSLKNIPEPVLIYEVLIDSIPELSAPSQSALQMSKRQGSDHTSAQAAAREAEEAREARNVEEAKKRAEHDKAETEEARRKKIEQHYARAEEFVRQGKPEDAERELAEIYKLEPELQEAKNQRRQEEEARERVTMEHLARARELVKARQFDEAEAAVNEIFRVAPLHVGAQQILQQIEDERYKLEEEERMKKVGTEHRGPTEDEVKIEELLEKARHELELEQFTEAIFTLRELFLIDPNHFAARRLEENIRQAEQAKQELLRLQAKQEDEIRRREELDRLRNRLEQHKATAAEAQEVEARKINYKLIGRAAGILLAAVFLLIVGPRIFRIIVPKTASITVMQFSAASSDSVGSIMQDALPMLLVEDLQRCDHITVAATVLTMPFDGSPANFEKIASQIKSEYLLAGSIESVGGKQNIAYRLYSIEDQKLILEGKKEVLILGIPKFRGELIRSMLDELDIAGLFTPPSQSTQSPEAYGLYLHALKLMRTGTYVNSFRAVDALKLSFGYDENFPDAYALFAQAAIRIYESREVESDLEGAIEAAKQALKLAPENANAQLAMAEVYRFRKEYKKVIPALEASLLAQPGNAEAYRELALISLIGGNLDDANQYSETAVTLDPQNPRSHFTLGIILHFRRDFEKATAAYAEAVNLGSNDSLLTVRYMVNAWLEGGNSDRVIRFLEDLNRISPNDFRFHYWIGRAYQFATSVKSSQQWLEQGKIITDEIIDQQPGNARAFAYGGLILTRLGQFQQGEAASLRGFELNASVENQYRLANMYSVQKNKEEAINALKNAIARKFDFAEILNPDFVLLTREPEFAQTVFQDIGPRPNVK
jgi:class 3 adenylate cyclase